jgi:siderophore synthetase component
MSVPHSRIADHAAAEHLLRCWLRETPDAPPSRQVLRVDLVSSDVGVEAPIEYWSRVGWHRFGPARLHTGASVDAATLAALLAFDAAARNPAAVDVGAFVARVVDSTSRIAEHLTALDEHPADVSFLAGEQAMVTGYPLHPAPKSRPGMTGTEAGAFSPELRGSYPLHWFAADPAVVSADSAGGTPLPELFTRLAGESLRLPPGTVPVPAHPWQAREVVTRAPVRALLAAGRLHDLGPAGPAWSPTSSVRTVYLADSPVMLKLSLGIKITNLTREHQRAELPRGPFAHRLLDAGLAAALRTAHPRFGIVRDPAWQAVDVESGHSGLEVVVRENPFTRTERVSCVAGLAAVRPGQPGRPGSSALSGVIRTLASRYDRPLPQVACEWFDRYLDSVIVPVLWLYGTYGLGLEAHQQNTLVVLDPDGWPVGGWYRGNQGYWFSRTRTDALAEWLPGERLDTFVADDVIDERLIHDIGINNVLGMIGALGSQELAPERDLLTVARRKLGTHGYGLRMVTTLLDSPVLRCKANLLTEVYGMDEREDRPVYVDLPNPLVTYR